MDWWDIITLAWLGVLTLMWFIHHHPLLDDRITSLVDWMLNHDTHANHPDTITFQSEPELGEGSEPELAILATFDGPGPHDLSAFGIPNDEPQHDEYWRGVGRNDGATNSYNPPKTYTATRFYDEGYFSSVNARNEAQRSVVQSV